MTREYVAGQYGTTHTSLRHRTGYRPVRHNTTAEKVGRHYDKAEVTAMTRKYVGGGRRILYAVSSSRRTDVTVKNSRHEVLWVAVLPSMNQASTLIYRRGDVPVNTRSSRRQ